MVLLVRVLAAAAAVLGHVSPRPTCYNNSLQLVVVIGLSMLGPDSPDYHMLLRVLLLPQQCSGHVSPRTDLLRVLSATMRSALMLRGMVMLRNIMRHSCEGRTGTMLHALRLESYVPVLVDDADAACLR